MGYKRLHHHGLQASPARSHIYDPRRLGLGEQQGHHGQEKC
jgi:hypothetical protein